MTENTVALPVEPKPFPSLTENRLVALEQVSYPYRATFPFGVPVSAAEQPTFWAHNAKRLRPLYRFEAVAEDGTWLADLIVLSVGNNWARVQILSVHTLGDSTPIEVPNDIQVKWGGPAALFRVFRDGVQISPKDQGFPNRAAATAWVVEHMKTIGR